MAPAPVKSEAITRPVAAGAGYVGGLLKRAWIAVMTQPVLSVLTSRRCKGPEHSGRFSKVSIHCSAVGCSRVEGPRVSTFTMSSTNALFSAVK